MGKGRLREGESVVASGPGSVRAALYVRVSTMHQVDRDSLNTQETRLKNFCASNGLEVYRVYRDEGVSAKDTKRPELERLLDDVQRGKVGAVVVNALDRITRSLRDLLRLVDFFAENNVRFISITQSIDSSTAVGRLMRDLLGLLARFEREVDSERVATGMHHRALLGKWNGGVTPYGYTTFQRVLEELVEKGSPEEEARKKARAQAPEPKKLYPDPAEAEVVKRIFETFLLTRSVRKTTHTMNGLGMKTRAGGAWVASSVHRVLTSPIYVGKILYGKRKADIETGKLKKVQRAAWKVAQGNQEALISEDLFREAKAIMESRYQKPTRAFRTYLLSGLIRCGLCGGPMHGYTFRKKVSGKVYVYYKCHYRSSKGPTVCKGLTVPAKGLEEFVVKTLTDLSKDQVFLQDKEKMLAAVTEQARPEQRQEDAERLKKAEKELQGRIDTLLEKLEAGLIQDEDFRKRYESLKAQLRENRAAQEKASDTMDLSRIASEALNASFEEISSFGKNWEFLDEQARAAKIGTIVKRIKVFENKVEMQVYLDVKEVFRTDIP